MLILPETPRFLIKQGRPEKAAKSLAKIRRLPIDHAAIQDELGEIQANHEYELSLGKSSYIDCFRGKVLKRLLTGCLLQALQQLTGINFIFYVSIPLDPKPSVVLRTDIRTVWNAILQEHWYHQSLHYQYDYQCRECHIDSPRLIRHRQVGSATSVVLGW